MTQPRVLKFAHNLGVDNLPPCSITMGVATIMTARKIYLLAWGDDKADIIKKAVEDKVSDTLPASYLQMHNNANVCIDLAAGFSPYPYPTSVAGYQL